MDEDEIARQFNNQPSPPAERQNEVRAHVGEAIEVHLQFIHNQDVHMDDEARYDAEDEEGDEEMDIEGPPPRRPRRIYVTTRVRMNQSRPGPSMPCRLFQYSANREVPFRRYHYPSSADESDEPDAFPRYEEVCDSDVEDAFAYTIELKNPESDSGYSDNTLQP